MTGFCNIIRGRYKREKHRIQVIGNATMVFFAACVHPPKEVPLPQGYALTRDQLVKMAPRAAGIPFTFEHAGIMDAAEQLLATGEKFTSANLRHTLNDLATQNPERMVIGTITAFWESASGAWWVNVVVDAAYDAIIWLIARGHCRGVSLTHIADPTTGGLIPLEVSLCKFPARDRCYIYKAFRRPFEVLEYMRGMRAGTIHDPSTMDAETPVATPEVPAPVSKMEQALAALSPEHRRLIEDRLVAASNKMQRAIEEKEKAVKASTITESNLRAQVGVLKAHIDPEILTNCHIDNEDYLKDLYSDNANDVRRTLDRVLIAANTTLMQYKNRQHMVGGAPEPAPPAMKRARTEAPASAPVASSAPVDNDRDSALYRIMSDTFDIM
jgi:hypothetical protein